MIGWRLTTRSGYSLSTASESFAVDQSWYFTAGEIKIHQQSFGRRQGIRSSRKTAPSAILNSPPRFRAKNFWLLADSSIEP